MSETQLHERTSDRSEDRRQVNGMLVLPAEARLTRAHAGSLLDDPDLAGNPVALAHARAKRENRESPPGADGPIGTALLFLVVVPAILLLVSNPLGWVILLGACFGFAYLFGFGGIL